MWASRSLFNNWVTSSAFLPTTPTTTTPFAGDEDGNPDEGCREDCPADDGGVVVEIGIVVEGNEGNASDADGSDV